MAGNLVGRLRTADAGTVFWNTLGLLAELAFILLLFARSRQPGAPPESGARGVRLLKNAAQIAAVAAGLAVVLNVFAVSIAIVTKGRFI